MMSLHYPYPLLPPFCFFSCEPPVGACVLSALTSRQQAGKVHVRVWGSNCSVMDRCAVWLGLALLSLEASCFVFPLLPPSHAGPSTWSGAFRGTRVCPSVSHRTAACRVVLQSTTDKVSDLFVSGQVLSVPLSRKTQHVIRLPRAAAATQQHNPATWLRCLSEHSQSLRSLYSSTESFVLES